MTTRVVRRRVGLQQQSSRRSDGVNGKDIFFINRIKELEQQRLIPIIGDTIRNAHIFQKSGVQPADKDDPSANYSGPRPNITEEIAQGWARGGTFKEGVDDPIVYPLTDDIQIARVAQFYALVHGDPVLAKQDYLEFLKDYLLTVAESLTDETDVAELAFINELREEVNYTFSDVVYELDFPRCFHDQREDPLRILARLPIKIYITTSYHDFVEKELQAAGKNPQSRLCYWNGKPDNLQPEHTPDPQYWPSVNTPLVYHLLGMEQYPPSMVLSEDDYLEFLWELASDRESLREGSMTISSRTRPDSIIPEYLRNAINDSSLLVLGYRLQDWDLKAVLHGLLKADELTYRKGVSTAIHIDLENQQIVKDKEQAETYLRSYFKRARFEVRFEESDAFLNSLWEQYQKIVIGVKSA
ncbi:MAG: hypothetical protein CL608_23320 [Anaerolineaceae bacterium]|nr:hypothetical protein [Anaerolineaceae bacterium]